MKKIIFSLVFLGLAFLAYRLIPTSSGDPEGLITFKVMDEEAVLIESELAFEENTTLFELLDANYDLKCADHNYQVDEACEERPMGRVILVIESIETDWTNSFFQILINDEPANYGVDLIQLNDGDEIIFTIKSPW